MAGTAPSNFWHRLRHTPLRDAVRGRVTGRLDWRETLAAGELPAPLVDCITRVVCRTRLWRKEQADVAAELISHFRGGLSAEATAENLIRSFGDEKIAAKLIRRAKLRNRPVAWHVWRWFAWATRAMIAAYALLAAAFFLQRPSPRVDYVAQVNQSISRRPEGDRGWPLYRQVILAMCREPMPNLPGGESPPDWLGNSIDGRDWPQMQTFLRAHAADMQMLRQATTRPAFGFVLGVDGSEYDPILYPGDTPGWFQYQKVAMDRAGLPLAEVVIPFLNESRCLAQFLQADAKLAAIDQDGGRIVRDIESLYALADQLSQYPFLINDLVAVGIDSLGLATIERALTHDADLLTDEQWVRLAHRIGLPQCGADLIHFENERIGFHDFVQRAYTDDGHGGGHLTAAGVRVILARWPYTPRNPHSDGTYDAMAANFVTGPLLLMTMKSREQILLEYDAMIDRLEAEMRVPYREVDRTAAPSTLEAARNAPRMTLRYGILREMVPFFDDVPRRTERYLGNRDGILIGIAMELYHRQHHAWPATLAELSPTFLPSVPVDRFTGGPLHYRVRDGQPIIYSVGADRVDDGGVMATRFHATEPDAAAAAWWPGDWGRMPHGDWILYSHDPRSDDDN